MTIGSPDSRARRPPMVLLDTNAFFLPLRSGVDLGREITRLLPGAEVRVPSSVIRELDRLVRRRTKDARIARALAERFPVLETDLDGDPALETLAQELEAWIVTGDQALRDRLDGQGLKVIFPRERQRLELSRPVT